MLHKILQERERRAVLMGRMMQYLDVDIGRLAVSGLGTTMTSASHKCIACQDAERCRSFLDGGRDDPARFCPNRNTFAGYRRNIS